MVQVKPKILAIVAIAVVLAVGAVYLIGRGGGNPDNAGASSSLSAWAVGEVANFRFSTTGPKPLPALSFLDGEGNARSFADFEGKLVLLNLWATWCGPCREEMPALDRLQAELGSDRFEVVALSVEREGMELARKFLHEVGVEHLGLFNDPSGKANFTLKAFGLPTTLLLSPQGEEIGRMVGPAHWDSEDAKKLIEAALAAY